MSSANLTNTLVRNTLPEEKRIDIRDTGVPGLMLRVEPSGNKQFYADCRHGGRRKSIRIGSATLLTVAQARDRAREILARVALGDDPRPQRPPAKIAAEMTLREFVEEHYAPWVREHRKSGRNTVSILLRLNGLLDRPCSKLSRLEVSAWRSQERAISGNKCASLNRKIGALVAALNWGARHEVLPENPCRGLERLTETDSAAHVRYLSADEMDRLFEALEEREAQMRQSRDSANEWRAQRRKDQLPPRREYFVDHLFPMVLVSLNTGIRRGSLFRLEWRDVNLDSRMLTIRGETAKSGKTYYVPLNDQAHGALRMWREQSPENGLVFPSPGDPETPFNNCNTAWEHVLRMAGIDHFRWHDMRHTFASRLVMAGVDLNVVRELMGHASLAMTIRYAHLAPETKRAAVDRLGVIAADSR